MPRYFFDVAGDRPEIDETGIECPDDATAREIGTRFLGELLLHEPHRLAGGNLGVVIRTAGAQLTDVAALRAAFSAAG